jgi:diacylglycerol kinase family enzyme
MITPYAHIGDGTMDLVFVKDDVGRTEMSSIMLKLETGEHIMHPKVHYVKVLAYMLEPKKLKEKYGLVGSDGEQLPHKPVKILVHPALTALYGRP